MRRRVNDFARVLSCRFPTIQDARISRASKMVLRNLARWRYATRRYDNPWGAAPRTQVHPAARAAGREPLMWRRARGPFALAVIAAVTRLVFPFDGLYGQDAFAYSCARAIWPHLRDGAPLPVLFWPRGYPAAVAMLLPVLGGAPAAGQLVNALAGAWAAAATVLLGAQLDAAEHGGRIVAGVCVAASGIVLRTGRVVMADGLALALAATALWCAARVVRTGRAAWLVPCAVAIAWGAVTRWQIGLVTLPIAFALASARRSRAGTRAAGGWRRWWRGRWCWSRSCWRRARSERARDARMAPALEPAERVPPRLSDHRRPRAISVARRALLRGAPRLAGALFPAILALAVVGGWRLVRERRGPAMALLLGWPLVDWAFVSGIRYENPRFIWPALPSIAALAGIGFDALRGRLTFTRARRWPSDSPRRWVWVSSSRAASAGAPSPGRTPTAPS